MTLYTHVFNSEISRLCHNIRHMARYVKNEKGYEKSIKADWDGVKKGLNEMKKSKGRAPEVTPSL